MARLIVLVALSSLTLSTLGCGAATSEPHRSHLSDDALAEFTDAPASSAADVGASSSSASEPTRAAIELAGGERFVALRALIRFRASDDATMHCAVYALEHTDGGLVEGRRTVGCDETRAAPSVVLAPVEEARGPQLSVVLEGARPSGPSDAGDVHDPAGAASAPPELDSVSRVHVWLTTDRRVVDGDAAPVRWPTPAEEGSEVALGRSPENLSEIWEAVMYPSRYRTLPN